MRQILRPKASLSISTGNRGRRWSSAAVVLLSILASSASAQVPVTQLTSVFPPGGKAGTNFAVTTTGADQDEPVQLLFSHPGPVGKPKMATAEFRKTARPVPNAFGASAAADVYEVLLYDLTSTYFESAPRRPA